MERLKHRRGGGHRQHMGRPRAHWKRSHPLELVIAGPRASPRREWGYNGAMTTPADGPPRVAAVILYQGDRVLLQHRDDDPALRWPGRWAIFGGHVEDGETPE